MSPLALDLFAGTGSATAPFRDAGWDVVRVELDAAHEAEYHQDVRTFSWAGRRPALVWASPPCEEFARGSMPWTRKRLPPGWAPSLELVRAALRVVEECRPDYFVIENSKGATRWLRPLLGEPLCLGPVRLFGRFPRFRLRLPGWKRHLSGRQVRERATMPYAIGDGLRRAIESSFFWQGAAAGSAPEDLGE